MVEQNEIQINTGITINADFSVKNIICVKKYVLNPGTCICENGKYLISIMDNLAIFDEVIKPYDEEIKTIPTSFNEKKKVSCKIQNFYILLDFLFITITLLIAVSIYCYLIKYQAKQKTQN